MEISFTKQIYNYLRGNEMQVGLICSKVSCSTRFSFILKKAELYIAMKVRYFCTNLAVESIPQAAKISSPLDARMVQIKPLAVR
jgi:hypothetical protein